MLLLYNIFYTYNRIIRNLFEGKTQITKFYGCNYWSCLPKVGLSTRFLFLGVLQGMGRMNE